jgi:hypothetical protein
LSVAGPSSVNVFTFEIGRTFGLNDSETTVDDFGGGGGGTWGFGAMEGFCK